jgi:predicted NBD/HSP70 family sugar kinase
MGGTKTAIALYDADTWKELSYESVPTGAADGWQTVWKKALDLIQKTRQKNTAGMGMGIAGLIEHPEGKVLTAPHIPGAEGFALRDMLAKETGLKAFVDNDSRCFALAEAAMGAGKGKAVVVGVTMGTGVGGGIVKDGKVWHGEHGFAGEIGHMLLRPGEPPYPTEDMRGDAEQFFSGTAMGKRCEAARKPEEYLEGQACSFLHPHLFQEISWMLASLTYLLDPSIVVFGGSAGLALKPHLHEIKDELQKWLLPNTPLVEIATATAKHPGTLGAALLTK